jgi:polyisoprenoid-binding protein YceI
MRRIALALIALSAGLLWSRAQETYRLDSANSAVQIHVDTAGALGFIGHTHLIQAPLERGRFIYYPGDPAKSSVELVVDASALQVLDPTASAGDRKQIQATMQSDRVLSVSRYPKICFKSSKIQLLAGSRLQITGDLAIRSQTNQVIVEAALEQVGPHLKANGTSRFKQTTFGIQPVAAGLGTVRVKDELNLSFQVSGQPDIGLAP